MPNVARHLPWTLGLCLSLLATGGCTRPAVDLSSTWPFGETHKTKPPGITTADDRISELEKVSQSIAKATPDVQERLSVDLAHMIQREQDPLVRIHVIRALSLCYSPTSTAVLRAGLQDSDPDVREECCRVWGQRGGGAAVQELGRVLGSDTNLDVRIAAARGLGTARDVAGLVPLADAVADADPALRRRALESLRGISGRDLGPDPQAWRQYAQSGAAEKDSKSFAQRVRNLFR